MRVKRFLVALSFGMCLGGHSQPAPMESVGDDLFYFLCTQQGSETPVFTLQVRDPIGRVRLDRPYRTMTMFRDNRAFAFEPALGMGFGDGAQEMGFEIGNGRITLYNWPTGGTTAAFQGDGNERRFDCKKTPETAEERFRHVPRTYMTEGTPQCLGSSDGDAKRCRKTVHFTREGKVTWTEESGSFPGDFAIISGKVRVTLTREGKTEVHQFTLMGDEWKTLRLDQDGTLWKLQPLNPPK